MASKEFWVWEVYHKKEEIKIIKATTIKKIPIGLR